MPVSIYMSQDPDFRDWQMDGRTDVKLKPAKTKENLKPKQDTRTVISLEKQD